MRPGQAPRRSLRRYSVVGGPLSRKPALPASLRVFRGMRAARVVAHSRFRGGCHTGAYASLTAVFEVRLDERRFSRMVRRPRRAILRFARRQLRIRAARMVTTVSSKPYIAAVQHAGASRPRELSPSVPSPAGSRVSLFLVIQPIALPFGRSCPVRAARCVTHLPSRGSVRSAPRCCGDARHHPKIAFFSERNSS